MGCVGERILLVGHQQKGVGMILMWGEILLMRDINDAHNLCGEGNLLVENTNKCVWRTKAIP
jgi:hypothetical protein